MKEVVKHPDRQWNREYLSHNRGITLEIMSLFDHEYTHELQHLYYPKIKYKDTYLSDIDILCIS